MKVHLLSGFLGSGKTTAIQQASRILLQRDARVGVITNDQGIKLVDADFFKSLNIPGRQVANGCFCCNFNELDDGIESLIKTTNPGVIFAESVGSCTDIVATVAKPLFHTRNNVEVTVSVFADARLLYMLLKGAGAFDKDVYYIYFKQLEEAGIIVINKVDCMDCGDLHQLRLGMQERYGFKELVFQNSLDAGSVQQWLDALDKQDSRNGLSSLEIDYDIYGAGEAKLAWLDQEIIISQPAHSAAKDAVDVVNEIHKSIRSKNYFIGHLKFLLDGKTKISFTATSPEGNLVNIGNDEPGSVCLLMNARVQTEPPILSSIIAEAIAVVTERTGCRIHVSSTASFKPGFPKPTHRIV